MNSQLILPFEHVLQYKICIQILLDPDRFDRIRILQNVRILSDSDLDSDPEHCIKYCLIFK